MIHELEKKYNFDEKTFNRLRNDYISGRFNEKDNIIKGNISAPDRTSFIDLRNLDLNLRKKYFSLGEKIIKENALGYVIVNGGMSTRFGSKVKGVMEVFDGKSFIRLKIEQIKKTAEKYNAKINIFFMNSFATENATIKHLEENNYFDYPKEYIHCFNQFISRRITHDGNLFTCNENPLLSYYGPGHGDFIYAFKKSHCLDKFIKEGGKELWYSNVDNLGATIDEEILGYHVQSNNEMTVEIAQKYPGDKGGVPAIVNDKLQLVEGFSIPHNFNQDSIEFFNTATYIFKASALKKEVELPWYIVKKHVHNTEVIQFERLTGDLSCYLKCGYIIVEREKRFFPIKTIDDLEKLKEKLKKLLG